MRGANTAIVDRTWGLHEVQVRQRDQAPEHLKRLAYGPNFVYDEFIITNNAFFSLLINIATAVITFCLLMPPVSRLVFPFFIPCADASSKTRALIKRFGLKSGEGPSEESVPLPLFFLREILTPTT
jgi:hypothetical protein